MHKLKSIYISFFSVHHKDWQCGYQQYRGAQKESVKKVVESSGDYMGEDKFLRRKGNAAENASIIHKIALFFLERLKKKKKRAHLLHYKKLMPRKGLPALSTWTIYKFSNA